MQNTAANTQMKQVTHAQFFEVFEAKKARRHSVAVQGGVEVLYVVRGNVLGKARCVNKEITYFM